MILSGQASPDDGDASVLTFAQPVVAPVVEEQDEEEESYHSMSRSAHDEWMR